MKEQLERSDCMIGNVQCLHIVWRCALITLLLIICALGYPYAYANEPTGNRIKCAQTQECIMVLIGASYAKDWDIRTSGKYRIVNKGIGGEETYQMRARFENDVIKQRPSAVLIWGFINDIFRSPKEGISNKLMRTRENIRFMINRANAAGIRPILATEVFITSPNLMSEKLLAWLGTMRGKQSYQSHVNAHVKEMNSWIRETAKTKKITILDFELVLADESGERQRRYAAEDGSHLSTEAYTALTEYTNRVISDK